MLSANLLAYPNLLPSDTQKGEINYTMSSGARVRTRDVALQGITAPALENAPSTSGP
jgi:hypothetical protein